jgi:hypothetical protein
VRTIRSFLVAGAVGGLCGGCAAAVFQWLVTEHEIRAALKLEAADTHEEMFSRTTQLLGGMAAAVIYGVVIGVVFAVVLAKVWHRLGPTPIVARVGLLAASAYLAWSLAPELKYPPNPPSVGDPDTVGRRTVEYLTFLGASVVLMILAWVLWAWLTERGLDGARRMATAVGAYLALLGLAMVAWPEPASAGSTPADLVWRFRIDSLLQTALLWLVLWLVCSAVLEQEARSGAGRPSRRSLSRTR